MKIKNITEIANRIESIDGQNVYVLDKTMIEGIAELKARAACEGDDAMWRLVSSELNLICEQDDFGIAFITKKYRTEDYLPYSIYRYEGAWRRVTIQNAKCSKCDWVGTIATPLSPDLYLTLDNRFEIMSKMRELPFLNCPKCGGKIPNRPIWIKEEN